MYVIVLDLANPSRSNGITRKVIRSASDISRRWARVAARSPTLMRRADSWITISWGNVALPCLVSR
ncbi:hypothetical protein STENM36S_01602 [Streptomyces tendae]